MIDQYARAHGVILCFIYDYQAEHGYPPDLREISKATGYRSPSTINRYIRKMTAEGLVAPRPSFRA